MAWPAISRASDSRLHYTVCTCLVSRMERLVAEGSEMKIFWAIAVITLFAVGAGMLNALYMVGAIR